MHPGNRRFRDLIHENRRAYLRARKNDKPNISRSIVRSIRQARGRFLKRDEKLGVWFEIGDDAAREKTSQALRQKAPHLRKIMFDADREAREHPQRFFAMQQPPQHFPDGSMMVPPYAMGFPPGCPPMMFAGPAFFMAPPPGANFVGANPMGPPQPPPPAGQSPAGQSPAGKPEAPPPPPAGAAPTAMMPMPMDPYQQAMFHAAMMGGMPRFPMAPMPFPNPMMAQMPQAPPPQQQQQPPTPDATPVPPTGVAQQQPQQEHQGTSEPQQEQQRPTDPPQQQELGHSPQQQQGDQQSTSDHAVDPGEHNTSPPPLAATGDASSTAAEPEKQGQDFA